jgi:hypothetical protein
MEPGGLDTQSVQDPNRLAADLEPSQVERHREECRAAREEKMARRGVLRTSSVADQDRAR